MLIAYTLSSASPFLFLIVFLLYLPFQTLLMSNSPKLQQGIFYLDLEEFECQCCSLRWLIVCAFRAHNCVSACWHETTFWSCRMNSFPPMKYRSFNHIIKYRLKNLTTRYLDKRIFRPYLKFAYLSIQRKGVK